MRRLLATREGRLAHYLFIATLVFGRCEKETAR